jgi:hypothetical protein
LRTCFTTTSVSTDRRDALRMIAIMMVFAALQGTLIVALS